MRRTIILFFVTAFFCFGQTFSRADRILQSAETAKSDLRKAIADLDADIATNNKDSIADAFHVVERDLDELSYLQWQAKDLLKSKFRDRNFSRLGQIKLNQLDRFSRESFKSERQKLCDSKKRIKKIVKEYELRSHTPELSFFVKILAEKYYCTYSISVPLPTAESICGTISLVAKMLAEKYHCLTAGYLFCMNFLGEIHLTLLSI